MVEEKNKPIEKFRSGTIEVAVWENKKDDKVWHSISHKKGYKDSELGEWKDTTNYSVFDIPVLVMLMNKAYEFIMLKS